VTLDSVLNTLVPIGIFVAIAIFIYHKGQKPIDKIIGKIKDWISEKKPDVSSDSGHYILGYEQADY